MNASIRSEPSSAKSRSPSMLCGPSSTLNCSSDIGILLVIGKMGVASTKTSDDERGEQDGKSRRTPGKSDSGSVLATATGGWRASDRRAAQSVYHRTMTAPATSRPRKSGTRIGGTSHSLRSNFWILDIPTAVPCGGSPKLSVTDSSQNIDGDGSQQTL